MGRLYLVQMLRFSSRFLSCFPRSYSRKDTPIISTTSKIILGDIPAVCGALREIWFAQKDVGTAQV